MKKTKTDTKKKPVKQAKPSKAPLVEKRKKKEKNTLHPELFNTIITCACGNEIKTKSIKKNVKIEICSSCHPFYTGQQKLVDTAGRIDKFIRKYGDYISKLKNE